MSREPTEVTSSLLEVSVTRRILALCAVIVPAITMTPKEVVVRGDWAFE